MKRRHSNKIQIQRRKDITQIVIMLAMIAGLTFFALKSAYDAGYKRAIEKYWLKY